MAFLWFTPARAQVGGQWATETTLGTVPEPRHESAFVRVGDHFYLLGGRGKRTIQRYDPETRRWSNTNTVLDNIHHLQATPYGGRIYLLGALTDNFPNENPLQHVLIYDPAADTLLVGPAMPADRLRGSSGVAVVDGIFYVIAGNRNGHSAYLDDGVIPANVSWTDAFDPRTGQWTRLPDAPHARDHFFAEVIDGNIYVAGGRRSRVGADAGAWADLEPAVDVFDPAAGRWLSTEEAPTDLPTARAGSPTAVVDGRLYVMGGEVEDNPPADLALPHTEVLEPKTGRWQRAADLVRGRHATQAIVYRGRIYLAAGSRTKGGTEITPDEDFIEVYRPEE
jgi:hypothetical protein